MSTKELEKKAWHLSTFITLILAAAVFLIRYLIGPVFDLAFEVCIFYVPAFMAVVLFLYFRNKPKK